MSSFQGQIQNQCAPAFSSLDYIDSVEHCEFKNQRKHFSIIIWIHTNKYYVRFFFPFKFFNELIRSKRHEANNEPKRIQMEILKQKSKWTRMCKINDYNLIFFHSGCEIAKIGFEMKVRRRITLTAMPHTNYVAHLNNDKM